MNFINETAILKIVRNALKEDIEKKGKNNQIAHAKGLIAYWAKQKLGLSGVAIGKKLGLSRQAVSLLVAQGEKLVKEKNYILTS